MSWRCQEFHIVVVVKEGRPPDHSAACPKSSLEVTESSMEELMHTDVVYASPFDSSLSFPVVVAVKRHIQSLRDQLVARGL